MKKKWISNSLNSLRTKTRINHHSHGTFLDFQILWEVVIPQLKTPLNSLLTSKISKKHSSGLSMILVSSGLNSLILTNGKITCLHNILRIIMIWISSVSCSSVPKEWNQIPLLKKSPIITTSSLGQLNKILWIICWIAFMVDRPWRLTLSLTIKFQCSIPLQQLKGLMLHFY